MVVVSMLLQSTAALRAWASRTAITCGIGYLYLRTSFRKQPEFGAAIPPLIRKPEGRD